MDRDTVNRLRYILERSHAYMSDTPPTDSTGKSFEERRRDEERLRKSGNRRVLAGTTRGKKKRKKKLNAGTEQKVLAFPGTKG